MSCPNCRCHNCRSYYRNPSLWGASAWASHMDAPPIANEGPATSLETSMTEHFLGPMRRNPPPWKGPETSDDKIQRLYRELLMTNFTDENLYRRLMRCIEMTGQPVTYFFKDGIPEPPRDNPTFLTQTGLWDPLEARLKKLCLYSSDLSMAEISEHLNIPIDWVNDACRRHRQDYRDSHPSAWSKRGGRVREPWR